MRTSMVVTLTLVGAVSCGSKESSKSNVGGSGQPAPAPPQLDPADRVMALDKNVSAGLEVEVGCSPTKPRVGIARVHWRADKVALAAGDLSQHRIDIAIDKRGFERGYFAKAELKAGGKSALSKGLQAKPSIGRALTINIQSPQLQKSREEASVEVEDLEPGTVYFIRIAKNTPSGWVPGETVRVDAPTCVADDAEEKTP